MFKALVQSLRKSSPELKALCPNLHKIFSKETFHENNIKSFIQELEIKDNFNEAFTKLIQNSKSTKEMISISNSELEVLEKEFKYLHNYHVVKNIFKYENTSKFLEIIATQPKDGEHLNQLIQSNKHLKNKIINLIDLLNKHKIKLSLTTLTLGSAGVYLFDAAKNLSGCYKYELTPSGEYKLLCKISDCESKNNSHHSINDKICNEYCLNGDCNFNNCMNKSTTQFKYMCLKIKWHDAINILTNRLSTGLGNFVKQTLKYIAIFIIFFCLYYVTENFNLLYRIILFLILFIIVILKLF
jgi:hypothetical protein